MSPKYCRLHFFIFGIFLFLNLPHANAQLSQVDLGNGYQKVKADGGWKIVDDDGKDLYDSGDDYIGWSDDSEGKSLHFPQFRSVIGYRKGEKWGLMTLKGKKVTSPDFDTLRHFENGLASAKKGSGWGLIDRKGKTRAAFSHNDIQYRSDLKTFVAQTKDEGIRLLDNKGKVTFSSDKITRIGPLLSGRMAVVNTAGRHFIADSLFTPVGKTEYDSVRVLTGGLAKVWESGLVGVIGRDGQKVLPIQYSRINILPDGNYRAESFPRYFPVTKDGQLGAVIHHQRAYPIAPDLYAFLDTDGFGVVDVDGEVVVPATYDSIYSIGNQVYAVQNGNLLGLISDQGVKLLPNAYDSLSIDSASGLVLAKRFDGYLLYTTKGAPVSRNAYENLWSLDNGLFAYSDEMGKVVLLRTNGRTVPFQKYDKVWKAGHGYSYIETGGLHGLVDANGMEVLAPVFRKLKIIGSRLATFEEDGRLGVIDLTSQRPIAGPLENAYQSGPNIVYGQKGKRGLLNADGRQLTEALYDSINYDKGGSFHLAWSSGKLTLIDESGKLLYGPKAEFQKIYPSADGRVRVLENGSYGFVDRQGRLRITNHYEDAREFSEGVAPIKVRGRWGLIDDGETIRVQPFYDSIGNMGAGLAVVKKDGRYGLLTKGGETPLAIEYEAAQRLPTGNFLIRKGAKFGLANAQGAVKIPFNYDRIEMLPFGLVGLQKGSLYGIADQEGDFLQKAEYDELLVIAGGILLKKGETGTMEGKLPK